MVKYISITILTILFLIVLFDLPGRNKSDENEDYEDDNYSTVKREKRTVGGSDAAEGAFPYQISLRTETDDFHFCSGSILRPTVILTAAHCVYRKKSPELIVVAGSNKLSSGGTRHNVIIIVPHENFDESKLRNDIALLILYPPVMFSGTIKPIHLDTSPIGPGIDVTLSGWGKLSVNGVRPDNLQFLILKTISVAKCKKMSHYKDFVTESTICTLTKKGEGACEYDSGGPLVANGRQIGIVSWGEQCAVGYPDIYTRIENFIPWIEKNIDRYSPVNFRC